MACKHDTTGDRKPDLWPHKTRPSLRLTLSRVFSPPDKLVFIFMLRQIKTSFQIMMLIMHLQVHYTKTFQFWSTIMLDISVFAMFSSQNKISVLLFEPTFTV